MQYVDLSNSFPLSVFGVFGVRCQHSVQLFPLPHPSHSERCQSACGQFPSVCISTPLCVLPPPCLRPRSRRPKAPSSSAEEPAGPCRAEPVGRGWRPRASEGEGVKAGDPGPGSPRLPGACDLCSPVQNASLGVRVRGGLAVVIGSLPADLSSAVGQGFASLLKIPREK